MNGQAHRTFTKSFNISNIPSLSANLSGKVEVKTWTESFVRVQVDIVLENGNENLLKSLMESNRYLLAGAVEGGSFVISAPAMSKEVKTGTQVVREQVHFTLFVPEGVKVNTPQEWMVSPQPDTGKVTTTEVKLPG
jgi:hypothetical protein